MPLVNIGKCAYCHESFGEVDFLSSGFLKSRQEFKKPSLDFFLPFFFFWNNQNWNVKTVSVQRGADLGAELFLLCSSMPALLYCLRSGRTEQLYLSAYCTFAGAITHATRCNDFKEQM